MNENFYERLNQIKDRLSSPELLSNAGLGNKIGFYIFDYPPERELAVRRHLEKILPKIPRKIAVVNLFELLIEYLKNEKMLADAVNLQGEAGEAGLLNAFKGILEGARIAPLIAEKARIETHDAVILTGAGNAFPLIRTHYLLKSLQILMNNKPLVVFYPGVYSGQNLSLFGKLRDENYYRAFRLVV